MKKITAILPARNFDYYIKNRNLLSFLDTNLLEHKIGQLKKLQDLSEILVCSDNEQILEIAKKYNVNALKRNGEDSLSALVMSVTEHVKTEHILWTNCCTPFSDENVYLRAINSYFEKLNEGYDSLVSVLPFKRFVIDDNGPVNFKRGLNHKESFKLNSLYFWISAISLASRENMKKWKYLWGNVPYKFILNKKEALEIKNEEDIKLATLYINTMKAEGQI